MTHRHRPQELGENLARIEKDLDILDLHADRLTEVERDICSDMKKTDREYKDSHFHSVPKPVKHTGV